MAAAIGATTGSMIMVAVTATRAAAVADTAKAAGKSGSKRGDKAAGPGAVASVEEAKGRQGGGSGDTVSAAETEAVDAAVIMAASMAEVAAAQVIACQLLRL